jgi:hypothetical protein
MFALIGPIFTFFYILAKKPFGFGLFPVDEQIRLALFYSIPVILIWIIHLFLIQPRLLKKLTIWNTILFLAWIHLFIGFYYYAFSEIYIFGGMFDFYWLPLTLRMTMLLGLFITSIMILIHGGFLIRKRIQRTQLEQTIHRLEEH